MTIEKIEQEFGIESINELKQYFEGINHNFDGDFDEWLDECIIYEKAIHFKTMLESYEKRSQKKIERNKEIKDLITQINDSLYSLKPFGMLLTAVDNNQLLSPYSTLEEQRIECNKLVKFKNVVENELPELRRELQKNEDFLTYEFPKAVEDFKKKLKKMIFPISLIIEHTKKNRKDNIRNMYLGRHEYLVEEFKENGYLKKESIQELIKLADRMKEILIDCKNYREITWKDFY